MPRKNPAVGLLALTVACSTTPTSSSRNVPSAPPGGGVRSAAVHDVPLASPSPLPSASVPPSCRYGQGDILAPCGWGEDRLSADVNAAIDRLAQKRPEIFDVTDESGPGEWKVLQPHAYLDGVVDELREWKFCAETDRASMLYVKNSNEFSEDYNILGGTDHVQRGNRMYRQTCSPASFPVEAKDAIAYVRVHFYGLQCEPGIDVPRNGADILPFGCRGFLTATPKLKNNEDPPRYLVGQDVTWEQTQGLGKIEVHDYPDDNPFNKILVPLHHGHYQVCATSHGVTGCQDAEVVDPLRR